MPPAKRKAPLDFSSMTWEELNRIPNRVINQLTRSQLKQFWKRQDELRDSTPEALERKKKLQEHEERKRALDKEFEESERRMDELWGLPSKGTKANLSKETHMPHSAAYDPYAQIDPTLSAVARKVKFFLKKILRDEGKTLQAGWDMLALRAKRNLLADMAAAVVPEIYDMVADAYADAGGPFSDQGDTLDEELYESVRNEQMIKLISLIGRLSPRREGKVTGSMRTRRVPRSRRHAISRKEMEDQIWELQEENAQLGSDVLGSFEDLSKLVLLLEEMSELDEMYDWVRDIRPIHQRFNANVNNFIENVKKQGDLDKLWANQPLEASTHLAVSSEPVQRAYERMDAAARRGGLKGLVDAISTRIRATRDPYKMEGIVVVLDDLIGDLADLRKAAQKKQ